MKKKINLLLFFTILFYFNSIAQKPGDSKPLADNSSVKGRRELRKEERVQRRDRKLLKKNERIAHREQREKNKNYFSVRSKKKNKEKNHTAESNLKPKN